MAKVLFVCVCVCVASSTCFLARGRSRVRHLSKWPLQLTIVCTHVGVYFLGLSSCPSVFVDDNRQSTNAKVESLQN